MSLKEWKYKYKAKKCHAKQKRIGFKLTLEDYITLGTRVGISPNQIGTGIENYHLSRIGDLGEYELSNCRFITHRENTKERDSHTNQVEVARKRALKQVKDGVHNNLKISPWENVKASKDSLEAWSQAQSIYEYWIENKEIGWVSARRKLEIISRRAIETMYTKFKEGWSPSQDDNWKEWKDGNDTRRLKSQDDSRLKC